MRLCVEFIFGGSWLNSLNQCHELLVYHIAYWGSGSDHFRILRLCVVFQRVCVLWAETQRYRAVDSDALQEFFQLCKYVTRCECVGMFCFASVCFALHNRRWLDSTLSYWPANITYALVAVIHKLQSDISYDKGRMLIKARHRYLSHSWARHILRVAQYKDSVCVQYVYTVTCFVLCLLDIS